MRIPWHWSVAATTVVALSAVAIWGARTASGVIPAERAVHVVTTGCGDARGGEASGVAVGESLVLTAAHVVAQADAVSVRHRDRTRSGTVVVWDRPRDLALVSVDGLEMSAVEFGELAAGDMATMVGGFTSGSQPATVVEWVNLTIEEALGTDRYPRLGYQLEVAAGDGDSGAGVYDEYGRLAGMIFGVDPGGTVAWATASTEIESLLAEPPSQFECDPATSFLWESAGL